MRTFLRIISASASIISALYADISRSNLRRGPKQRHSTSQLPRGKGALRWRLGKSWRSARGHRRKPFSARVHSSMPPVPHQVRSCFGVWSNRRRSWQRHRPEASPVKHWCITLPTVTETRQGCLHSHRPWSAISLRTIWVGPTSACRIHPHGMTPPPVGVTGNRTGSPAWVGCRTLCWRFGGVET